jgi:hypothetical protein
MGPEGISEVKCCREKYWSEKNDSEKIEMLKYELKRTQNVIETLCILVCKLFAHQHGATGGLLTEITIGTEIERSPICFRGEKFDQ